MLGDIYEAIKGVYQFISRIGKVVWLIITKGWALIAFLVVGAFKLGNWLLDHMETVIAQIETAWGILSNHHDAMTSAVQNGWPPEMANAVAYANAFIPVGEICGALTSLLVLYITCMWVRVLKSIIPVFNT